MNAAAILTGALVLIWPAFFNGYPLLFSDTGAFLHQTLGPLMIWDKPYVYGPFLHVFHVQISLWGPALSQGVIVSHLLWVVQRTACGEASLGRHGLVCAGAALLTSAPFSAALLMPDIFAPVVVLGLFLLGVDHAGRLSRAVRIYIGALTSFAIASHLAHLIIAAGVIGALALMRTRLRTLMLTVLPLGAALAVLLVTNLIGHGRLAVSPYGATFMLARLQADGPASAMLHAACPQAGWYLCDFIDRLPMDSDEFLWSPDSPVNRDAQGQARFLGGALLASEAGQIVAATMRAYPLDVVQAMTANFLRQLVKVSIGDTLSNDYLLSVRRHIVAAFPAHEVDAFDAARQMQGNLADMLAPAALGYAPVLLLALLGLIGWAARAKGTSSQRLLVVCVLAGISANAFATGALSKPHHRYQSRIVWLLPVAALLVHLPRRAEPVRTSIAPS